MGNTVNSRSVILHIFWVCESICESTHPTVSQTLPSPPGQLLAGNRFHWEVFLEGRCASEGSSSHKVFSGISSPKTNEQTKKPPSFHFILQGEKGKGWIPSRYWGFWNHMIGQPSCFHNCWSCASLMRMWLLLKTEDHVLMAVPSYLKIMV